MQCSLVKTWQGSGQAIESYSLMARFGLALVLGATITVLRVADTQAVPIDSHVMITGTVSLDTVNSQPPTGNATQTGTLSRTIGGATTTSTINGVTVTGANPLGGTLTDIGDGLGILFNTGGSFPAENPLFGGDYTIDIANTSATDTFKITFKVNFSNTVNASGADAFAQSKLSVQDVTMNPTITELFFTDLISDTVNGNMKNGTTLGSSGGPLDDIGMTFVDITVAPGATINLQALQNVKGGAFAAGSQYSAGLDTSISVNAVMDLTQPPTPIPEPGTLALFGTGLVGVMLYLRRRSAH